MDREGATEWQKERKIKKLREKRRERKRSQKRERERERVVARENPEPFPPVCLD